MRWEHTLLNLAVLGILRIWSGPVAAEMGAVLTPVVLYLEHSFASFARIRVQR